MRSAAAEILLVRDDPVIAALLSGGDSRLALDPGSGMSKYLCYPVPSPGFACYSSCTASPITPGGFALAADALHHITGAMSPGLRTQRLAAQADHIRARLCRYFGLAGLAQVILLPSGTDALLTAALLVAAERPGLPMTAILPEAAETGSGVRMAALCRHFDGPRMGEALRPGDSPGDSFGDMAAVEITLRAADGERLADDVVNAAFTAAAAAAPGRPVLYLTHGTKTGLIAPTTPPAGVDVIVDACQARIDPAQVRAYLGCGWPVAITGSKFFGGPAFSGALLCPAGRFAVGRPPDDVTLGAVLRWTAALDVMEAFEPQAATAADRLRAGAALVADGLAALPAIRPVGGLRPDGPHWSDLPSIFTFAVRDAANPERHLSVAELAPLYRRLGRSGVLLGQPVGIGAFGGLRIALGARNLLDGTMAGGLRTLFAALAEATRSTVNRATVNRATVNRA